jgi:hypothetical protein
MKRGNMCDRKSLIERRCAANQHETDYRQCPSNEGGGLRLNTLKAAVSHCSASDKHLQPLFGVDLKGLDQPRSRRRSEPVTSLDWGLGKL